MNNVVKFEKKIKKSGFYFIPTEGLYFFHGKKIPNKFHRLMQKLFFGFMWMTQEQYEDSLK